MGRTGLKYFNYSQAFIGQLNDMDDIYKNIQEHNLNKKHKKSFVFDDMIADMISNKKLKPIVTELFIRRRKLNISFFLLQNLILLFQNVLD